MNDQMKTKLLEKLMDFLSQLPDKEDLLDGGKDDASEGDASSGDQMGMDGKPKVEMLSIDAKPDDGSDELDKLKGL